MFFAQASSSFRRRLRIVPAVTVWAVAAGLVVGVLPAGPAHAAEDVVRGSTNYARATTALGSDVVLWRPTHTAGLRRKGPIDVIAYGRGANRATFVGSTYGTRVPSFTLAQKSGQTRWAATPVPYKTTGLVRSQTLRMGSAGDQQAVRVRILAHCRQPGTQGRRCSTADVARFGGVAEMQARTSNGGSGQTTTIRIDSNGLSYRQLLRVVQGLVPV